MIVKMNTYLYSKQHPSKMFVLASTKFQYKMCYHNCALFVNQSFHKSSFILV